MASAKHQLGKQPVVLLLPVLLQTSLHDLGPSHRQASLNSSFLRWAQPGCLPYPPFHLSVCRDSECTKRVFTQVIMLWMCVREHIYEALLVRAGVTGKTSNLNSKTICSLLWPFVSLKVQKYLRGLYRSVILDHFQDLSFFIYK